MERRTITDKEPTYTLEVWTGTGREYREMTRAELKAFLESNPQYILDSINDIIAICDASEKHKEEHLRYDIDAIRTKAQILKEYLLL